MSALEVSAHTKPISYQGDLRNLPASLAPLVALPNWVCWKWQLTEKGRWTKVPYRPKRPNRKASNNDPTTWGTHAEACDAVYANKADGIGFCLLGTEIVAFDIDKCRNPASGVIDPAAIDLVSRAASYTEVTISGTGPRVIGIGYGEKVHRKQKIAGSKVEVESYRKCERYIVVTGNQLADAAPDIADIDRHIDDVVRELDGN